MKKVVIFISICLFLITGCSVKKVKELSDAEKFSKEYDVSEKNPFVYAKYQDVIDTINTTGIIFLASNDYSGCKISANYLTEVAKKEGIKKIYYYKNINVLKEKNSKKYKKLLNYLKEYLDINEDDEYEFNLPIVVSIKDGNIVNYSNVLSKEKELSEEKLTKKKIKQIKNKYTDIINYKEDTE